MWGLRDPERSWRFQGTYGGEVWGPEGISGGCAGLLRAPGAFLVGCLWEALRLRSSLEDAGEMRAHGRLRGDRGFNWTRVGAAGWGGGPRRRPHSGHSRSGAHPKSPRRKEWEALTRFSASAISCTASRSFPALSMSPAAAATTSSPGSDAPSAPSPFSPRDGERRRGAQGLSGLVVPGRALEAEMGEASTTIPRRPQSQAGWGSELADCRRPGFRGEGRGSP